MENKLKRFISSTVSYHDFKEAVNIAQELNCGIEISRFGKLSVICSENAQDSDETPIKAINRIR